jgi:hypothetical protein
MDNGPSPFAETLPRLFELKQAVSDPTHPDAYFQNFEKNLATSAHWLDQYMKVGRTLAVLDGEAWRDLRERAAGSLLLRDGGRGWRALFDTFDEAKGYVHLQHSGCTDIAFIKRTPRKTPDLRASENGALVLCEVKTINISQDEAERRASVAHGAIVTTEASIHLPVQMLKKISATIEKGIGQLDSEDPGRAARRIVFVVLHFDDWVGDYQTQYIAQLDAHLLANPIEGADLVFCPASNLFARDVRCSR